MDGGRDVRYSPDFRGNLAQQIESLAGKISG
jgi:hypothetical protein